MAGVTYAGGVMRHMLGATCERDAKREGAVLGLIVASVTWVWVALVDAALGQPFHAFETLGGIVGFTIVHSLLNILFGIVLVSAIHSTSRSPSVFIAFLFGLVMFEVACAMITPLLAEGVGNSAWVLFFGGSLIGTTVAVLLLSRRHPLAGKLDLAEHER